MGPKTEFDNKSMERSHHRKRHFHRAIKLLVFLLCLSGFIIQQTQFLRHYLTHPTVVNIEVVTPGNFVVPAITFCNTNPLQRTKYCDNFPDKCIKPENIEEFCMYRSNFCNGTSTDFRYPNPDIPSGWLAINDIQELGQDAFDFFNGWNESVKTIFFEDLNGFFRQCFSLDAHFDGEEESSIYNFDPPSKGSRSTFLGSYFLNVELDEMFNPTTSSKPGILFSVHSPYEVVNPNYKGALMKPGHEYKIHIRLEKEILLKYPYKTDCINYTELWNEDNTTPRSQQMCQEHCQKTFSMECHQCVRNLAVYDSLTGVCDIRSFWMVGKKKRSVGRSSCENEIELKADLEECTKNCKSDCEKLKYIFTSEERLVTHTIKKLTSRSFSSADSYGMQEGGYTVEKQDLGELIKVEIFVDDPEILVMSHKPQYADVELFSYIGGFMGCWLGISIWALVGIIGNLFSTVTSFFNKRSTKFVKEGKDLEKEHHHQGSHPSIQLAIKISET